jgi:hypothetical protein
MLGWSISPCQIVGCVNQSDVRERLREIANLPSGSRVVFLRQQPDIVAQFEKPLEHPPRVGIPALQDVVVGKPKTAGEEGTFVSGQAVNCALCIVPRDKTIPQQVFLNGGYRAYDPGVVSRQEADQRRQQ